jgi:hypothetical protein
MTESSKTQEELKLLELHLDRINKAVDEGESLAAMWLLERKCPEEFGRGEWVNVRAIIAKKYPDINLESEEDVLAAVDSWESSAYVLERHFQEFAYRK